MKVISYNKYEICLDTYDSQEEAEKLAGKYKLVKDTWRCDNCGAKNDCVGDFECEEDWYRECFVVSFKEFKQSVFSSIKYGACEDECKQCRRTF